MSLTAQEPEEESHFFRNVAIIVALILIGIVVVSANHGNSPSGGSPIEKVFELRRDPITPSSFAVQANQMIWYPITLTGSGRVVGRFQAIGGTGNDIEAVIASADQFENWKNGHTAGLLYQSGKTTIGNIDEPLAAGTYYLAFNNRFSLLTGKTIISSIVLQH